MITARWGAKISQLSNKLYKKKKNKRKEIILYWVGMSHLRRKKKKPYKTYFRASVSHWLFQHLEKVFYEITYLASFLPTLVFLESMSIFVPLCYRYNCPLYINKYSNFKFNEVRTKFDPSKGTYLTIIIVPYKGTYIILNRIIQYTLDISKLKGR